MLEPLQDTVLQAGLVDLDATFVIQLGIFLVFAVLLNVLVVKPIMKAQQTRWERMEGSREEAEGMDLRAAEAAADYEKKIAEARRQAVAVRDELRREGEQESAAQLASVRSEAEKNLRTSRAMLEEEAAKVRGETDGVVKQLAKAVADRILSDREDAA
ncbi:MAG: hypothetical protein ACQEXJ_12665 [Myxococcota bacterium]